MQTWWKVLIQLQKTTHSYPLPFLIVDYKKRLIETKIQYIKEESVVLKKTEIL